MSDPRLSASVDGIAPVYASFKVDASTITYDATKAGGSSQVGLAVNLSTHQTVQLAGNTEVVLGKLIKVESDGIATVQIAGGMTLPGGTSATLTPGSQIMGDLLVSDKGYIQTITADAAGAVVGRGLIIDASTTTAVEVVL